MSSSSSLLKTLLHKTISEGIYKEIASRTARYYYFLGKTISWEDETAPQFPIDSVQYEKATRNEIITVKEIKPADISFVIPRIDWFYGNTYDIYDDNYSTELMGIDLSNGGLGYLSIPTVEISAPNDINGIQATAVAVVFESIIIGITLLNKGTGYTTPPTVTITSDSGVSAVAVGVISKSPNGYSKLEDSLFYVMTSDYNVYKCISNNNNSPSTIPPIGTQVLPTLMADGYIWKYMYNVPIALRTKFLTEDQMPILTALSRQFYSSGEINNITIDNKGTGYTYASIAVSGDGYLEKDPIYISSSSVQASGSLYADGDTISISSPIETSSNWIAATIFLTGHKILSYPNIYEVVISGVSSSSAPNHTFGTYSNGDCALKFLGSIAKAYPTFSAGGITSVNMLGSLREINLTSHGSGYTSSPIISFSAPNIVFNGATGVNTGTETITLGPHWFSTGDSVVYSNGGGTSINPLITNTTYYIIKISSTTIKLADSYANALLGSAINLSSAGVGSSHSISQFVNSVSAVPIVSPTGVVQKIIFDNFGYNYNAVPTVTIGTAWTPSTVVSIGQQYFASNRLYTVTGSGTTDASTAPTGATLGTSYSNGTATLTYVGTPATGTAMLQYGAGYDAIPRITINSTTGSNFAGIIATNKSEAKLIPIIENGQISIIQIDEGGIGYTSAVATITGDGIDASISINTSVGNINTVQANNELLTTPGTINNIQLISKGFGYDAATVLITGDGINAAGTCIVSDGKVVQIDITNQGSNYTYANIVISGNGHGASGRTIISPFGGHGKDSFSELYARTLMMYTNVSRDKNQGFEVNNDYRQVGIIKNLKKYNNTNYYSSSSGSACFVFSGTIDTNIFVQDMLLTTPRVIDTVTYFKRYRVVSVLSSGMLVQSLDNDIPQILDIMTNENNESFSVATVTAPTIDKYSGDMLFIDNKAGFTPSINESVNLRTVIRF